MLVGNTSAAGAIHSMETGRETVHQGQQLSSMQRLRHSLIKLWRKRSLQECRGCPVLMV